MDESSIIAAAARMAGEDPADEAFAQRAKSIIAAVLAYCRRDDMSERLGMVTAGIIAGEGETMAMKAGDTQIEYAATGWWRDALKEFRRL